MLWIKFSVAVGLLIILFELGKLIYFEWKGEVKASSKRGKAISIKSVNQTSKDTNIYPSINIAVKNQGLSRARVVKAIRTGELYAGCIWSKL